MRASTPDELRPCLRESLGSDEPAVIGVSFGEVPFSWPCIIRPPIQGQQRAGWQQDGFGAIGGGSRRNRNYLGPTAAVMPREACDKGGS